MRPAKPKRRVEFWTVWHPTGVTTEVCSMHRTQRNAVKEALRCERTSGFDHDIVQVVNLGKPRELKRRGQP